MRGKWERRIEIDKERERERKKDTDRRGNRGRWEGGGDYIDHVWTECL